MTIAKGRPWGKAGPLPPGAVIVGSDAEAGAVVREALNHGEPGPTLGLLGGDLCRTLGGTGDPDRLHSADAMNFPVDLGTALVDGRLHWFVAHLVARDRLWRRSFVAMNAQWYGRWNLGPRAHPNDGLLDTYQARLRLGDLPKVRARLATGTHLPHPRIVERRAVAVQVDLERPRPVWLDGVAVGSARTLSVRIEPDALTVVV